MDPHQLGLWVAHQIATHCEPALTPTTAAPAISATSPTAGGRRRVCSAGSGIPAEDSETLLTALEPLARTAGDQDSRTAGQRRADALVDLSEQVLRHGALPDSGGLRPQLSYVLPADWAAGQHTRAACTACGPRCPDHQPLTFTDTVDAALPGAGGIRAEQACATAAWTGPQTRPRIEALLCDARITKVLLTPTGQVHSLQPLRDTITPAQRRALAARDLHCTARGCTRPPAMCDAHHLDPPRRRRPDDPRQPRPAVPTPSRPVAPRHDPAPPPHRPLAPRPAADRPTTRTTRRPAHPSRTVIAARPGGSAAVAPP